ncbi:TonB-dependent receptor [Shewanella sp. AS16]|uniref:TonB-dependent receptor domain-containing protein n=1 Tax=Shewanella sp. AS16 TaxID=2907625 RepID=UPI001F45E861|nr:TonB-dependent receptor [Shewanella sp. AS16]MCE9687290.1 TonB-dependent receptor [Shewanella sp. AS16]
MKDYLPAAAATELRRFKPGALAGILGLLMTGYGVAAEQAEMDRMVVTATGSEHLLATAPASISIITAEEVTQYPIKDLGDVLKTLPGVSISSWAGGRNGINLRGLDENYVLMLVNGKRVSSSNGLWRAGNFDTTSIPLELIDHVEVIRGPMSALYGSDAVGGVINIITRRPQDDWESTLSLDASFMDKGTGGDRYRASLYTTGKLTDNLGLVFSAEKADQDIWVNREVTPKFDTIEGRETLKFASTLSWQIDDSQSLELDLASDRDDVPLTTYGAYREQSIDRITVGLTHNGNWQWGKTQLLANLSSADIYDYNSRYNLQPPLGRDLEEINTTLRGTVFLDYGYNNITLGGEYLKTQVNDPVQYPVSGGDSQSLTSLFIQDEIGLADNLIATLGVRGEDSGSYGTHVSPRLYLSYLLNEDIVLKGGVGTAFRAPSLFESSPEFHSVSCKGACSISGNPDLQEETSVSTELALLVNKDLWSASVTVFHNKVENLITVESWDGTSPVRRYFNEADVTIKGVEATASIQVTDDVSFAMNYTYLDTQNTQGKSLSYRPENTVNAKFDWQVIDDLNLYAQLNYYGEHLGNRGQELSGYSRIDLGGNYFVSSALKLKLGLTNLTDEQPVLDEPTSDMILQGRALFVGASYSF